MAISIQDNFDLGSSLPIDSRFVKSGRAAMDSISFKYDGLQVFDTSARRTFVWNVTGSTWSAADVTGIGDIDTLSKWSSVSGLTSSAFLITNVSGNRKSKVGLNVNTTGDIKGTFQINPPSGNSQPIIISHVSDSISFIGYNYHYTSSDQYINQSAGSAAIKFRDNGETWFYNRTENTTALGVSDNTLPATGVAFILRPASVNVLQNTNWNNAGDANSAALIRSTNAYSTKATPDYTWWYNDQVGFYHPASNTIGVTVGDSDRMRISPEGVLIKMSTSTLLVASSVALHIDGGNGTGTYLQITNGTTTGTNQYNGLVMGVNADAIVQLQQKKVDRPITLHFSNGNVRYRFGKREFSMYSSSDGETFNNITNNDTGGGGSRVIRGTKLFETGSSAGTFFIESIFVPSSSQVAVDCTFVTSKDGSPKQFVTKKILKHFTVNSAGVLSNQNVGTGNVIELKSSSSTLIASSGEFDIALANTIRLTVQFNANGSGSSVASYTVTINSTRGH